MVSVVVLAHGNLAKELVNSCELVAGKQDNLYSVEKGNDDSLQTLQEKLIVLFKTINKGCGVLILTDLFGGTPCNASVKACKDFGKNIAIISGVNLSMLLSAVFLSNSFGDVTQLASKVAEDGKKGIIDVKQKLLNIVN
ncbi:MAG: PTS sugar transporter subunit IIA [Elusimicrobiota bacterium]|jgi:mannose/fructose/sorbose-specific phosphotransferase system IIA component|nr:PTS sugar transporter subunit IIA [Elusimicrobiota bacterium]